MEIRSRVRLSSSWEAHGDLNAVLYIVSSSGSLLDEPLSSERNTTPLSLCALTSDPDQPCLLHVDLSSLRGYISSQLELTSTSRTTELYQDEDDYVGTVRGTVVENCDSNGTVQRLYYCNHSLPSDSVCQRLIIKLLSLRGKTEVLLDRIQLVVMEDHGGSVSPPLPGKRALSGGQLGMQQLLGSFPVNSMPPFMQTLVSSLNKLTMQVSSDAGAGVADNRPAELSQLVQSLRQMRPPTVEAEKSDGVRENGKAGSGNVHPVEDKEESGTAAMEARLKLYIDDKFEQLERRLEKRLEELLSSRLRHFEDSNSRPLHIAQDEDID